MTNASPTDLVELRQRIERLAGHRCAGGVLPFGVKAIDDHLPGGGLASGALHEIAGRDRGGVDGAAAALFAAGIAARTAGKVLWCVTRYDLFAPGLAQAGLPPDRVIYVEAKDEKALLACFEEGLRHGGLSAVVGEVSKLSMTASRRLQLAAEDSHTLGLAVRRWATAKAANDYGQPTAAVTRWLVTAMASSPMAGLGHDPSSKNLGSKNLGSKNIMGTARWHLDLLRCRGGYPAAFDVEACDGKACLALVAPLVHGPAQAPDAPIRAAS